MRYSAGPYRFRRAPERSPGAAPLMRQRRGYSKAVVGGGPPGKADGAPACGAPEPAETLDVDEIIVVTAIARYTTEHESADRARRPAALRYTPALSASCLPPRRVAAPGYADRMNPKPSVFAEATPMTDLRDAMIPNAPGFLPNSFIPHSTASPAAVKAAAAARLGVPPEWQSACSSTPPTPKKRGWW